MVGLGRDGRHVKYPWAGMEPGRMRPSENDLKVHKQLNKAGEILGLKVLDHLIVTRKGYCSLKEKGVV